VMAFWHAGGSNSAGRVTAFQAVGRGFESRLPLIRKHYLASCQAHVAQLVEHILGKDEVTGSTPVVGSLLFYIVNEGLK
jgi:hypothetical protein